MKKKLLIVFYRNPELGKVKTRLAATLGDDKALAVYLKLVNHTRSITQGLPIDKMVCYSHFVDTEDNWDNSLYQKELQQGDALGEKLGHAIRQAFERGYQSVCVIGSDCFELKEGILQESFSKLATYDAVIGPALDGGYYLLGMNKFDPIFFRHKAWSTDTVARETIADFNKLKWTYFEMPLLRDVDREEDLPDSLLKKLG